MPLNPRVIIATAAVAAVTSIFSLVAAPLLELFPENTAYAQEGPRIKIELDPAGAVVRGNPIEFTLNFTRVTATGTTYKVKVLRAGGQDVTGCSGGSAFEQMTDITAINGSATATGTISGHCPAGQGTLVATLYDGNDDEIVSTAIGFTISDYLKLPLDHASSTIAFGNATPTLGALTGLWGGHGGLQRDWHDSVLRGRQ